MRRSLLSHPAAALTMARLSLLLALFLLLAPTAGADVVTGRVVGSDNNEPLAEARMKVFVIPINENYVRLDEMTADIIMSVLLLEDATRAPELFKKSIHVYLRHAEAECTAHHAYIKSMTAADLEHFKA